MVSDPSSAWFRRAGHAGIGGGENRGGGGAAGWAVVDDMGKIAWSSPEGASSIPGMSELKTRLQTDLTAAMKARDAVRTRALRMLLTAISNEEVSGKSARELSDDEIIKVITKEVKKRREAAEAFEQGGRADRAADERAEGEVLSEYLPEQLSDEELADLVRAAIAEAGVSDVKGMGAVMKLLTPRVAGRAEGRRVADEVRRQLS